VITAVFGLLGVIVGGVLGGLVQLRIERLRTRNLGEAAAALIAEELQTISVRSEAFLSGGVAWTAVISMDAWEAYKTPILLALPQELGYVLVTAYGLVEGSSTVSKRDRGEAASALSAVARLAGEALQEWRSSGQVSADLFGELARTKTKAEARFRQLREIRLLETEERFLVRARYVIDRTAGLLQAPTGREGADFDSSASPFQPS
jgi:hypothetical protein